MKRLPLTALLGLALLAAPALHAEIRNAVYLLGGIDAKMLTNQDADNYFNLPGGQLGPQGLPSGVIHLGVQFQRWAALEVSADLGRVRNNDVTYQNFGFTTREVTTRWTVNTFSVTPGLTWAGAGYVNLLGLRVGQANLMGHVDDNAFGTRGSYDQKAQAYDLGVLWRTSCIVADHLSVGLEFGYDWTQFKDISNSGGTGTYDPPHSPERNISTVGHNGDQTTLDFSGGHVALTLGLWSGSPVTAEVAP